MASSSATAQPRTLSLTEQASWLLIAKLIGFVFSFAAPLIVVRVLDQNAFGLYKQAFLIVRTSLPLLTLAFYMNVFYFLPRQPANSQKVILNVVLLNTIVGTAAMLALIFYPPLIEYLVGTPELAPYAALIGITVLLTISGYFLEVIAIATQEVRYSTAFIILAQLTKGICMVAAALLFGTLSALLWAAAIQGAIQCAVLFWYLQKRFPGFLGRPDWGLMLTQMKYTGPLGLAHLATVVQSDLHMYMVAHHTSAADYAIYAVGCFQVPLLGLFRESVNSVLIPRIIYLQQQNDKYAITTLLANAMRKLSFVFWPSYVFLTVCASEVIGFLYEADYSASAPVFMIYLIPVVLMMFMFDPVYRAYAEYNRFVLGVRFVETVLLVAGLYAGIHYFGMMGAVAAVILIVFVDYLVLSYKAARILDMKWRDVRLFRDFGRIGVCALAGGAMAEAVRFAMPGAAALTILLVAGSAFCIVYAMALYLLAVPTASELEMVRNKLAYVGRKLHLAA